MEAGTVLTTLSLTKNFEVLLQQDLWKHYFMGKKTRKRERIEENYITTFNTLNLRLFANLKNYFEH